MATLKAKETLALERGRVEAGQTFWLHNQEAAANLVANGSAEEVAEDGPANPLDSEPDTAAGIKVKTDKSADTRQTKPESEVLKTKTSTAGPAAPAGEANAAS